MRADLGYVRSLDARDIDAWFALQSHEMPDPFDRANLEAELTNRLARRHGVFVDGALAAVFLGWLVVDELQVLQIATATAFRRRGLGRRLLTHAMRRARAAGAVTCTLEVRASNGPAQALYRALGFAEDGRRAGFYPDGEDAVLMRAPLTTGSDDER